MTKARDLARLSPNSSGQLPLASGVSGTLPDVNAPSGSVIQVLSFSNATAASIATETITRLGETYSITPQSASNKILVTACAPVRWSTHDCGYTALHRQINGGTWVEVQQFSRHSAYQSHSTGTYEQGQFLQFTFLDAPNTTGVVTYSWAMSRWATGTGFLLPNGSGSGDRANWTLMEIAA